MIDRIIELLKNKEKISAWTITESRSKSKELFFVKNKLDMNRATDVLEYEVKVFVDFEEEGKKFKGDASLLISPADNLQEIEAKLDQAIFSAGFVKNAWYDLPEDDDTELVKLTKYTNLTDLEEKYQALYEVLFKDYGFDAKMNSCELFAIEADKRVVTSKGVDVSFPYSEFAFELVTDCDSGQEPVEIFKEYQLTNINLEQIEKLLKLQLEETEGRSKAKKNEKLKDIRLVLSGDAVEEFLSFYIAQASDSMVYMNISKVKLGEQFVGDNAAESLNITLDPSLASSTLARPVDGDGKKLSPYKVFEAGKAVDLRTSSRYSHYLNLENKGNVQTFLVEGGQKELKDYLDQDYIEILAFSSFLMDPTTGDFGGEFRLAKYVHDGVEEYISGGSVSENIFKVQERMRLSKELEDRKLSRTPKAVIIDNVTIAGA